MSDSRHPDRAADTPIAQGRSTLTAQSARARARAAARDITDSASLMSLVTILDLQRYRHITNNAIDISLITLSTYDKQRKCDITDNGTGICALPHKTASTYGFMLLCA